MSIDYNALAIPKGKTTRQLKARKDRADAKQLKAFRDAVWRREAIVAYGAVGAPSPRIISLYADCEYCGRTVTRDPEKPLTGEVHHRISRRHKATRYDPNNGVLLCNHLVNNCHQKAELGLINV